MQSYFLNQHSFQLFVQWTIFNVYIVNIRYSRGIETSLAWGKWVEMKPYYSLFRIISRLTQKILNNDDSINIRLRFQDEGDTIKIKRCEVIPHICWL